jgi:predicted hotdog family 3-hydroxylacyl-ACP dehydratase
LALGRDWIVRHLPHQGAMCLLDQVDDWDLEQIRCRTARHRAPDNPLRSRGCLPGTAAIELAAQAMALHGALLGGEQGAPRRGYLASVRGVDLHVARLDGQIGDLEVSAERLIGDGNRVIYGFSVSAAGRLLATGRAAVVLDAEAADANRCFQTEDSTGGAP